MDLSHVLENIVNKSCQQRCFYHFSDKQNLASIRHHGLLSMHEMRSRGICPPAPGGDAQSQATDAAKGTDYFVCLSFTIDHPMAYVAQRDRGLNLAYLMIDPTVILRSGVMLTDAASNQTGVTPGHPVSMLDTLDLEALYQRTDWNDPPTLLRVHAARKYEILVPSEVPLRYILNPDG